MSKKKLSIKLLKVLEPLTNIDRRWFDIIESDDLVFEAKDKDPNSDFFFKVKIREHNMFPIHFDDEYRFIVTYLPASTDNIYQKTDEVTTEKLIEALTNWVGILVEYENLKSIFDDPILNGFRDEIIHDLKMDNTEGHKPLTTANILLLNETLESLSEELGRMETETNRKQIKEIQSKITEVQEQITTHDKKTISEKVAFILANTSKLGVKFIRDFYDIAKKEIYKQIFIGGVKLITDGHDVAQLIEPFTHLH